LSFSSDSSVFKKKATPPPNTTLPPNTPLAHSNSLGPHHRPFFLSFPLSIRRVYISFATRTPLYLIKESFGRAINELSRVEPAWAQFDSIRICSAWNSVWVRHKFYFRLEFDSFKVHEQFGWAR
jgi:hypothetical protein